MSDMTVAADTTFARRHAFLEQAGLAAVYGVAGALQFSIAVAQILLTIAFVCWIALVVLERETIEVPRFAWPLALYAAVALSRLRGLLPVLLPPLQGLGALAPLVLEVGGLLTKALLAGTGTVKGTLDSSPALPRDAIKFAPQPGR